jgi:hypothetical protein
MGGLTAGATKKECSASKPDWPQRNEKVIESLLAASDKDHPLHTEAVKFLGPG